MADTVIEVHELHKRYGDFEAVHGTSFTVHAGEIFGLLGTNGAGKTTTIEILEGYRRRTSGEVTVLGVDPGSPTRAWRQRIGLVLQDSELDPVYTPRETVGMFARYFAQPRPVAETLELVGLTAKADDRIGSLSGGQRRRVDVALGIVGRPELLFLDEPTTGFDPQARQDFWAMLGGLRRAGTTMVLTTHYMEEAQALADQVAIMRGGTIVAEGDLEELTSGHGGATAVRFRLPAGVSADDVTTAAGAPATAAAGVVTLKPPDVQATLTALLDWAHQRQLVLAELEVVRPSLNDVFLQLVEEPS